MLLSGSILVVAGAVVAFIWGLKAWPLLGPSVVGCLLLGLGQLLPDNFRLVPPAGEEVGGYIFYAALVACAGLYVWWLRAREFTGAQIAGSQAVQFYSWVTVWFVAASIIFGGKNP